MEETSQEASHKEHFFPSGALAFFALLVFIFALIWFAVYFMMIKQA